MRLKKELIIKLIIDLVSPNLDEHINNENDKIIKDREYNDKNNNE